MANIRKHERGYLVRWEAGRDAQGNRVRRSKVLATLDDARTFLRQVAPTEGTGSDSSGIGDAMLEWIDYRESMGAIQAKTAERQRNIARNIAKATGNVPAHKLTSAVVETALRHLHEVGGHKNRPLCGRTILHHRTLLSQFCRRMVAQGRMSRNPVEGTEAPKAPKVKAQAPTLAQAEILLGLCANSGRCNGLLRLIVLAALHTGARRGEILALKWECVDFDRGEIAITRSISHTRRHGLQFKPPKTEAGRRTLPCSSTLMNALRAHKRAQAEQRIAIGSAWADNDLVFATEIGEIVNPEEVSRQIGTLARTAGFASEVAPLHGLRHLHGTRLNAAGLDAKTIQARLGHEDIAITLQLYVHKDDESARKAADIFEGLGG